MNGAPAEHVREGVPVLSHYCDALGIRAFAGGADLAADLGETAFKEMAGLVTKPVINMESAANHPCQALADWKTLDDLAVPRKAKFVLSWVNHPRALPLAVPAATVHMAAMRGMDVVVLRPEGFALPAPIMQKAAAAAAAAGGTVRETTDRDDAMNGAQVIYAKEWGSTSHYGDAEADARQRARARRLVRARHAGSRAPRSTANSCTACRCGVMSPSPTRCSMAGAASCSARPTTAWSCRPRCSTVCSPTATH